MATAIVGLKIRETRRALGISQSDLARQMGISPAYLNLIEFSKRRIGGSLLKKAADCLNLQPSELDGAAERRIVGELREVVADPHMRTGGLEPDSIEAFVGRFPDWANALARIYRSNRANSELATALSDRLTHDPYLVDVVHQMLTHISVIRSTSEILDEIEEIDAPQRKRFHRTLAAESGRLTDVAQALARYFDKAPTAERVATPVEEVETFMLAHDNYFEKIETAAQDLCDGPAIEGRSREAAMIGALERRDFTIVRTPGAGEPTPGRPPNPGARELVLPNGPDSDTGLQALAVAVAAEYMDAPIEAMLDERAEPMSAVARRHIVALLRTYATDALLLPAEPFLASATRLRFDLEALSQTWRVGFDRICRRLSAITGRAETGPRFAYLSANAAGQTIDRRPRLELPFPRYGSACPLWSIYRAFATPEVVVRQVAQFPDGQKVLFVARARRTAPKGFDRPADFISDMLAVPADAADQVIYGDGLDLGARGKAEAVGQNCRICPRTDCRHRTDDPLVGRFQG